MEKFVSGFKNFPKNEECFWYPWYPTVVFLVNQNCFEMANMWLPCCFRKTGRLWFWILSDQSIQMTKYSIWKCGTITEMCSLWNSVISRSLPSFFVQISFFASLSKWPFWCGWAILGKKLKKYQNQQMYKLKEIYRKYYFPTISKVFGILLRQWFLSWPLVGD